MSTHNLANGRPADREIDAEDQQLQSLTREELRQRIEQHSHNRQRQRFDFAPTEDQLLSPFDVFCLIMNRTIASGIFKLPTSIILRAGSSGLALVLWIIGGIIALCIVTAWVELALTIPLHYIFQDGVLQRISTPKSGGDKNYLEYIYKRPRLLMTCAFGITFVIFGNLAGNAIQFGIYMTTATHPTCTSSTCLDENKAQVIGWAVSVLTLVAIINVCTRRFAIGLNNILAVCKVSFLITVSFLGIIWGTIHGNGCQQINFENQGGTGQFGDVVQGLFYALFPYTGYEQPFYVLSEVAKPKKVFAKAASITMTTALVFYPLINVSYLCVTPYQGNGSLPDNMAIALFSRLANPTGQGATNGGLVQAMNVVLAIFIFGNLLAQTYTASRVKQEVAKEGILPWSLTLGAASDTIFARLGSSAEDRPREPTMATMDGHLEQAPIAATALHWAFEVTLTMSVGIPLDVSVAYNVLTYMYTYTIIVLLGFLTVGGLLYLKLESVLPVRKGRKKRDWLSKTEWTPWLDPLPVVVATLFLAFLLVAAFARPSLAVQNLLPGVPWWVPPLVGLCSFLLGLAWWLGLRFVEWKGRRRLETKRLPYIEINADGVGTQKVEIVEHAWVPDVDGTRRRRRE